MQNYIQLLTALVSAIVGGGIAIGGGYLTDRMNKKQRQLDLLRARGEELYSLVVRWTNGLGIYALRRAMVMQGKLTYNQCLDQDIQDGEKPNGQFDFARIELLIDVYFPSVRKGYDDVLAERSRLHKLETPFKLAYERGMDEGANVLPSYVAASESFDGCAERLKTEIRNSIRAIEP